MRLTPDEFRAIAADFKWSAFRLEARQIYNVGDELEEAASFMAGEQKPDERAAEWYQTIKADVAAGKQYTKVKILRRPLTDYQRYSLAWTMPDSVEAGMEYRVVDVTDRDVGLPDLDFWLYDNTKVVILEYNDDDSPRGAELIENEEVDQYLQWRDIALKESVPFSEYRA